MESDLQKGNTPWEFRIKSSNIYQK
jgi:hypothetical protein